MFCSVFTVRFFFFLFFLFLFSLYILVYGQAFKGCRQPESIRELIRCHTRTTEVGFKVDSEEIPTVGGGRCGFECFLFLSGADCPEWPDKGGLQPLGVHTRDGKHCVDWVRGDRDQVDPPGLPWKWLWERAVPLSICTTAWISCLAEADQVPRQGSPHQCPVVSHAHNCDEGWGEQKSQRRQAFHNVPACSVLLVPIRTRRSLRCRRVHTVRTVHIGYRQKKRSVRSFINGGYE